MKDDQSKSCFPWLRRFSDVVWCFFGIFKWLFASSLATCVLLWGCARGKQLCKARDINYQQNVSNDTIAWPWARLRSQSGSVPVPNSGCLSITALTTMFENFANTHCIRALDVVKIQALILLGIQSHSASAKVLIRGVAVYITPF